MTNLKDKVITEIKSKGYWSINIRPLVYKEKLIHDRATVKQIVRNAVVELRGWDYPHFSNRTEETYNIINGVETTFSWENHIEFWRMTQSGNFIHLLALREDRTDLSNFSNLWSTSNELNGKKLLGILGTLYTFIEIFEFTNRLVKQEIFSNNLILDVQLHDIYQRQLWVDSQNRLPFSYERGSHSEKPWQWKEEYKLNDFSEKMESNILKPYLDLVELFGWENPPVDVFKNDIQKFLAGKI